MYMCNTVVKVEYMYTTWLYCFSIVPRPKKEGTGDDKDLLRKEVTKYSMNAMVIDEFCVQVYINIICTTVSSSDYFRADRGSSPKIPNSPLKM